MLCHGSQLWIYGRYCGYISQRRYMSYYQGPYYKTRTRQRCPIFTAQLWILWIFWSICFQGKSYSFKNTFESLNTRTYFRLVFLENPARPEPWWWSCQTPWAFVFTLHQWTNTETPCADLNFAKKWCECSTSIDMIMPPGLWANSTRDVFLKSVKGIRSSHWCMQQLKVICRIWEGT